MTGETAVNPTPLPSRVPSARLLLLISSVALGLWIAALITMYVTTVYPQRHPANAARGTVALRTSGPAS